MSKNKAVFLDRDGTINREVNYLSSINDFKFLPRTIDALKLLSSTGYKIIIITNQSGIARGYFDKKKLIGIHKKMCDDLVAKGVRIDGIYYCPHHPDENCGCRKPGIDMLKRAEKDFCLNLQQSYMIGDTTTDIKTGMNAGCKTILVRTGYAGEDGRYTVKPDHTASDLFEAVKIIVRENETKENIVKV